jgi:aminoglycoside 2'-N-acetyltransferase I
MESPERKMSIEINVLNGDASWPLVEPLLKAGWPQDAVEKSALAGIVFGKADLRVLVEADPEGILCHVGLHRRDVTWNGRKMKAGGIGGMVTRPDSRRRGYASIALNAAVQTLKDEGATDFGLLFCEPASAPFYLGRGWKAFDGEIYADQPGGRMRFEAMGSHVMAPYVHDLRRAPRQGAIDLCGPPW